MMGSGRESNWLLPETVVNLLLSLAPEYPTMIERTPDSR
jgi:hypothetical protein